jgi:hypothetical protein
LPLMKLSEPLSLSNAVTRKYAPNVQRGL